MKSSLLVIALLMWFTTGALASSLNVCLRPMKTGLCSASFPRYYFNKTRGQCEKFYGCDGDGNNFKTEDDCIKTCTCYLPKDGGICQASFKRFFFNYHTDKCEEFIFGGCNGNRNNFVSEDTCNQTCLPPKESSESAQVNLSSDCLLPAAPGRCRGRFPRYFFNTKRSQCEKFIYGGCDGNGNNFETLEDCNVKCTCYFPEVPGPCRGNNPRYYYNYHTNRCVRFNYGGCRGNNNNFVHSIDCERTCKFKSMDPVCNLRSKGSRVLKYFYNKNTQQCESFKRTGTGNTFDTENDCKKMCASES